MNDLFRTLVRDGETEQPGSDRTIELHDMDRFWLTEHGTVDLFSIPVQHGEVSGPRDHVCRINAGGIFFRLPPTRGGEPLMFQAVVGPGTKVVKMPIAALQTGAATPEHADAAAQLIDSWVLTLGSGLSHTRVSFDVDERLTAGEECAVTDGCVVSSQDGVVWAFLLEGSCRFLGRSDIGIVQAGEIVPLCRYSWLKADGSARLHGESTSELLNKGNRLWQGLQSFHVSVSRIISVSRRRSAEEARRRLALRREEDRRITRQAYAEFASVLDNDAEIPTSDLNDPLLAACRIVGHSLGLEVAAPPSNSYGDRFQHPLRRIARASRFRIREVLLKDDWWRHDNGPLLGFLKEGDRPAALLQSKPGRYVLHDPVESSETIVDASIAGKLTPTAYMLYRPLPDDGPVSGLDLLRFGLRGVRADLWMIAAMGAAGGLLSLITPVAVSYLFGTIIPGGSRSQLLEIVGALLTAAVAVGVFGVVQALAQLRVIGRMGAAVEAALWDRLINLPAGFFKRYTAGDLTVRALGIARIQQLLSGAAVSSIVTTAFLSFHLVLLWYYGGLELFLAAVAVGVISLVLVIACYAVQMRYQRPQTDVAGKIQGLTFQLINGISKLRVSGAEKRAYGQWAAEFAHQKQLELKTRAVTNWMVTITGAIPVAALAIVFAVVAYRYGLGRQGITTAQFLAFNAAFSTMLSGLFQTAVFVFPLLSIVPLYERAEPILEALPESRRDLPHVTDLGGDVEAAQVSFRYDPDGPLVLKNVTFHARPGELTALAGQSGSGKSTLFRLILGFETPESGSIYFDGRDLRGLSAQSVRQNIGVVLQNGRLLPGSLFENIVGATRLTLKDAWIAARMAALDKDIEAMPMGMHTMIGEGGSGLSGGQRQRLLIARALVRRPRILLFDEATSALDNESQAVVSESLEQLRATRIVIAHRLSTIRHADRIYVIEAGEVAEVGTYEELMAKNGAFAALARRQIV